MKQIDSRKIDAAKMLRKMFAAGINQQEVADVIGCSRWMLSLWLQKRHEPSPENYAAIERAYNKFTPDMLTRIDAIVRTLEEVGVDLKKELDCTPSSLRNWRNGRSSPQSRYRSRLVELYRERA